MDDVNNLVDKLKGDVAYRQFDNAPAPNRQPWPVLDKIAEAQMRAAGGLAPAQPGPYAPAYPQSQAPAAPVAPAGFRYGPAPAAAAPQPSSPLAPSPSGAFAPPPVQPTPFRPAGLSGSPAPVAASPPSAAAPGNLPLNQMFGGPTLKPAPPTPATGSLLSRYGAHSAPAQQAPQPAPARAADPSAVALSDVFARLGRPSR